MLVKLSVTLPLAPAKQRLTCDQTVYISCLPSTLRNKGVAPHYHVRDSTELACQGATAWSSLVVTILQSRLDGKAFGT